MKIYLVGGAIRDELLDLPVKERDWVVVGAAPEELLAQGFVPVGKDFPVFLHPDTHEEYALARTERKVGKGYKGFTFYAAADVTLEADLQRRDLTINAMARSPEGELIDPYQGQQDLMRKKLRHVSPAFSEDPVRILRVARFAAKLPDFTVDPVTNQLMQQMVDQGEVEALVAERVWAEFSRALASVAPQRFFMVLQDCGALAILFPLINLAGSGVEALQRALSLPVKNRAEMSLIRFAVLLSDIELGLVQDFGRRYRVPKEFSELAELSCRYIQDYHNILSASPEATLEFIKKTDALRRSKRFELFLQVARIGVDDDLNEQRDARIRQVIAMIRDLDLNPLLERGLQGRDFADALYDLQIAAIKK